MAIYIISSICFIVMNLRNSIKFPKLKMLDDRVHNMLMNLGLNKFPLSPSTHQNLLKLLQKSYTVQAPNKDQFKEAYGQIFILLYDSYRMHFVFCSTQLHICTLSCS